MLILAFRFLLELVLLATVVVWGRATMDGWRGVLLGIGGALVVATLWGLFVSPKARIALPPAARLAVELALFGAGVAALWSAGHPRWAIAFAAAVVLETVLMAVTRAGDLNRAAGALALASVLFVPAASTAGSFPATAAPGDSGAARLLSPVLAGPDTGTVVLLHGLGRTAGSMRPMEEALEEAGFEVFNLGYPSRELPIDSLADTVAVALDACCAGRTVHFVTHSLGGILVRAYADRHGAAGIGRVVMLSPPNQGTELVDRLRGLAPIEWLLGPAFLQLGTDTASVPADLGPPAFEVGVITGDESLNPLFSWWIPGPDDGKVAVASARLEGAADFRVVPYGHTFIMRREEVVEQVLAFLRTGRFLPEPAPAGTGPIEPGLAGAGGRAATSSHGGRTAGA